jgi:hypothetical protein
LVLVALTNVAFWMCRIQFVLVYAEAAFYKWMGTTWLEGSAMHYAAQLDHFIRPGVASVFLKHRWLSMFFSFAGLAYQTAFPLLIWVRKARIPLLLAGVFFHGFIATAMKLPEFGTAMMVGYLLFIEEDSARKVLVLLRLKPVQSEQ